MTRRAAARAGARERDGGSEGSAGRSLGKRSADERVRRPSCPRAPPLPSRLSLPPPFSRLLLASPLAAPIDDPHVAGRRAGPPGARRGRGGAPLTPFDTRPRWHAPPPPLRRGYLRSSRGRRPPRGASPSGPRRPIGGPGVGLRALTGPRGRVGADGSLCPGRGVDAWAGEGRGPVPRDRVREGADEIPRCSPPTSAGVLVLGEAPGGPLGHQ